MVMSEMSMPICWQIKSTLRQLWKSCRIRLWIGYYSRAVSPVRSIDGKSEVPALAEEDMQRGWLCDTICGLPVIGGGKPQVGIFLEALRDFENFYRCSISAIRADFSKPPKISQNLSFGCSTRKSWSTFPVKRGVWANKLYFLQKYTLQKISARHILKLTG